MLLQFVKNQQKIQQFLTKILRLENGARTRRSAPLARLARRRAIARWKSARGTRRTSTRTRSWFPLWWKPAGGSGRRCCRSCGTTRRQRSRSVPPCWLARCGTSPSSPSRASRPCSSRLSRAPPRCSRLGRLPLCPCPLRAPPHFVAPSGAFRSSCPAGPALDSSSCRFLQIYKGLRIFAKFSPLVQGSAKRHFLFFSASLRTICSRPLAKLFMFT